jgi:hypothetical protein
MELDGGEVLPKCAILFRFCSRWAQNNGDLYNFMFSELCIVIIYRGVDVLSPTRNETSSEACQGRARFQQNRDASCRQVSFPAKGAEGNSHHSDRNISLFPSWSGYGLITTPVYVIITNEMHTFSHLFINYPLHVSNK